MLKLCRVTKVKMFYLVLVYVNFDLFEFSAAILEKVLLKLVSATFNEKEMFFFKLKCPRKCKKSDFHRDLYLSVNISRLGPLNGMPFFRFGP